MHSSYVQPRVIVVLGMHRSGTSALMGVLNLLGIDVGPRLLPAQQGVNDKGFWEHAEIIEVHDRLLWTFDSSWDDVCPLPDTWWACQVVEPFRQELLRIVQRDFAKKPLWGIKDPRMCRLLPLWRDIFTELGCTVSYIIITRNPYEVAYSLAHRDGFPRPKSYLLWLAHVLEAERWTRTCPRVFITYPALLNDWRATVAHTATNLSLSWPNALSTVVDEIEQFLEPGLRHYTCADDRLDVAPDFSEWIRTVYQTLAEAAQMTAAQLEVRLAPVHREMTAAMRLFGPLLKQQTTELSRIGSGLSQALEILAKREAQLTQMQTEHTKVGAGFAQALEILAERDRQLAQVQTELAKVGAGFAQALEILAEREAQLTQVQSELSRVKAHWLWRLLRIISVKRQELK